MKIGIDIRGLQNGHKYRGIGVYLRNLLTEISHTDHTNTYELYHWAELGFIKSLNLDGGFKYSAVTVKRKAKRELFENSISSFRSQFPLKRSVDVFLQPEPLYGLMRGTKNVCVAYDLIPMIFKEHYQPAGLVSQVSRIGIKPTIYNRLERIWFNRRSTQLQKANKIIAISNATKKDLITYYPSTQADKISVVHLAFDQTYKHTNNYQAVLRKHKIKQPFLLYVGGADFRKNLTDTVAAFEQVYAKQPKCTLVLVGKDFTKKTIGAFAESASALSNSRAKQNIAPIGYASKTELAALYSASSALLFPSLYEGFGMTVLEAMNCGCPVITYRNSSIPEVAGDAALYANSPLAMARKTVKLLQDERLAKHYTKAGMAQAAHFSWSKTAKETIEVLKKAAI